jgi:two-component system NarL family sensor kinase
MTGERALAAPSPPAPPSGELLARRAVALLRLLLLAAIAVGNDLIAHPYVGTLAFNLVIALSAVYALAALLDSWKGGRSSPRRRQMLLDLLLISVLAYCSGRGFPAVRSAFVLMPVIAAIRLNPRQTAGIGAIAASLYMLVALTHPTRVGQAPASVAAHALFVVWAGASAVLLATLRGRRERQILALSQARGRLVAQALEAEEHVRRRISSALHDNAVQDLLSARQDLDEAEAGDHEGLTRVRHALDLALCQLRGTIEELDPYMLEHLDLPSALEAIAQRAARHSGQRIAVEVAPGAGAEHAELIASLARELLTNAARHAAASRISLSLRHKADATALEVSDDGRGFDDEQALAALRAGHIGLASSRERVQAIGGRFELRSAPGAGTRIRCLLPAPAFSLPPPRPAPALPPERRRWRPALRHTPRCGSAPRRSPLW